MNPGKDYSHQQDAPVAPFPEEQQKVKKRRLHGACDACRKKKVKCDSANMPGNICTNCQLSNVECTHNIPRQPKKSETQAIYIQELERKLEIMTNLLQNAYPGEDIDQLLDLGSNPTSENSTPDPPSLPSASSGQSDLKYSVLQSVPKELKTSTSKSIELSDDDGSSEGDDLEHIALTKHFSELSLESVEDRFFGQSSGFMFFKQAATAKGALTGKPVKPDPRNFRRPLYWNVRPWELAFATVQEPSYIYPDKDLLQTLVFIYFDKFNPFYPLLHKPTFLRMLNSGEHYQNPAFGMVVLLVCACASRYTDDPRVMMPGDSTGMSSGWRFFCQVPLHRNQLMYKTTTYDLQYYALTLVYLHGTSIPNTAYSILGLGMRHALEKGVHRRKPNTHKPTVEEELMKRAFWCLVAVDRYMSSFLGRPSMIHDEDFDVDYPIECDDEYWEAEDPDQAFKQPSGKPSTVTAFVWSLKLCQMLAFTCRTLYSTKKSKILSGLTGKEWEGRIVNELATSLSKWKESLPYFLRWNPDTQEPIFFHQSAYLYATYYYIQIQIYRPFLTKKSDLSFPALAMCTNAARLCADMLEVTATRGVRITTPNLILAGVSAGLVMVFNIMGNEQTGLGNSEKEYQYLQKCMDFLKECERRSPMAGRLCDMLKEVSFLKDYTPTANKRPRGSVESLPPPPSFPPENITEQFADTIAVPPGVTDATSIPDVPIYGATSPDFDLSNLLLMQMGYTVPGYDSENNYNQEFKVSTPLYDPGVIGLPGTMDMNHFGIGQVVQSGYAGGHNASAEEGFSPWNDMPATFHSIDEWDKYLAHVTRKF
ncbi:hypothetical protein BDN70DRAFT_991356 [Pholiota conissans]|uniref:Zn(2)-C6 fungal-type domain-containing protein n=1 Tax=Pholiota conissans TaxID=109636 RepID=A0A9P6D3Z7_9AGAR|nr:hypothetical protein BDN70DRAFT_991356 [Pholiota conissans]